MRDELRKFLASGCWLGLMPFVPGSFGALLGLAWHFAFWFTSGDECLIRLGCLIGVLLFSFVHYWLTPWAQQYWDDADPKNFVLDEIVGYLCVPIFMLVPMTEFWHLIAAFCVFRILDAIKLPGARYIDRNIHSAHGVLFDDIVSACYTAFLMSILIKLV